MDECDAFRGIEIKSLNAMECRFLLDVLQALSTGPATLPTATVRAARDSMQQVMAQLQRLEAHGLIHHTSKIKSGHLVPEYSLNRAGMEVLRQAGRITT